MLNALTLFAGKLANLSSSLGTWFTLDCNFHAKKRKWVRGKKRKLCRNTFLCKLSGYQAAPSRGAKAAQEHLLPGSSKTWQNFTPEPTWINTCSLKKKKTIECFFMPSFCIICDIMEEGKKRHTLLQKTTSQEKVLCRQQFVFLEGPFRALQVSDESSKLGYSIKTKAI